MGANGLVGLQYVKRAKPDGYTVLLGSSGSLAIEPAYKKKVDFDVFKDFVPVAPLANYPYVLVVAQDSPYKTLNDLVEAARTAKVPLSFASAASVQTTNLRANGSPLRMGSSCCTCRTRVTRQPCRTWRRDWLILRS